MAKIDLKPLTLTELKALKVRVETAIAKHGKAEKAKALSAVKAKAKSLGFNLNELVLEPVKKPAAKPAKKKKPFPPVYRDPSNAKNTWSGRGRRPAWVVQAMDAGKSMDDLKI